MLTNLYYEIISINSWIILAVIALLVSLGITLVQKYKGNQKRIKRLKNDIKKLRKKLKKHKDDTDKMMEVQGEMTTKNLAVMKESFRPMVYYIIPTLLIFLWMGSALAYQPLEPNQPFNVTLNLQENFQGDLNEITIEPTPNLQETSKEVNGEENQIIWTLQGSEGDYVLLFEGPGFAESKSIIITTQRRYTEPVEQGSGAIQLIRVGNEDTKPFGSFTLFGWQPGWLAGYIIFSVFFGFFMRKLLKVA